MKSFDAIIGHKKIISHFEEAIKTGKVSHAYLLSGEDGSGKMMIAKAVAKALLCEHKDGCGECAACKQVDSLIIQMSFILLMKSMKSELMIFEKGSMRRSILNRIAEIIRFISLMMRIE